MAGFLFFWEFMNGRDNNMDAVEFFEDMINRALTNLTAEKKKKIKQCAETKHHEEMTLKLLENKCKNR